MFDKKPMTFGELKKQRASLPDVRSEMRANLLRKLENNETLFPELVGYEDTVLPGLINAILCGHNIILLGERGQGKTRIVRSMIDFLDDEMPAVAGCPIHDNPFNPICVDCIIKLKEMGDSLPINYVTKERRLVEKLATSDVSTADLIGEVDPIKIASGKTLDDESVIHFGLVPRAHRSIFAINELPDLAEKIQVAFFNIMEENDFQIKGFPVRLPLDILIIATANPEDYTNRGRIITPLKDRFDVQLRTHFPKRIEDEIRIMEKEAQPPETGDISVYAPRFMKEILAEITFQARSSTDINQHSGVSCRVSIRSYETMIGSAIHRCYRLGEKQAVPRLTDIKSAFPAISGKLELEYEAADSGREAIIDNLVKRAVKTVFDKYYRTGELASVTEAFQNGEIAEISQMKPSDDYKKIIKSVKGLDNAVKKIVEKSTPAEIASGIEFILEGMHLSNQLNKEEKNGIISMTGKMPEFTELKKGLKINAN